MFLQVLGHAEGLDLLGSEHGGHGLVGGEPLLVLGVLEVVLLQVGPETLDDLKSTNYLGLKIQKPMRSKQGSNLQENS